MISAILFDLVGTLIIETSASEALNTKQGYYDIQVKAIHKSLEEDGISVDWFLFKKCYEKIRLKQRKISKQTLREYDMCKRISDTLTISDYAIPATSDFIRRAVDIYQNIFSDRLQIHPSTYDILKSLTSKYSLGLVTNFSYYPGVYRLLDKFALGQYFKTIVISGEAGWKKPSERIFQTALSQLSAKPEETVFVGDSYEEDVTGARKAGIMTVFISKNRSDNEKADAIIESLMYLPSALQQFL